MSDIDTAALRALAESADIGERMSVIQSVLALCDEVDRLRLGVDYTDEGAEVVIRQLQELRRERDEAVRLLHENLPCDDPECGHTFVPPVARLIAERDEAVRLLAKAWDEGLRRGEDIAARDSAFYTDEWVKNPYRPDE